MKIKMLLPVFVVVSVGCSKADFGSGNGKKIGGGDVLPAGGQQNPQEEPLDVSQDEKNRRLAEDGPLSGDKELNAKTIELNCENSQGVIIDIGDDVIKKPIKGDETPFLELGTGKGVEIDTTGKPIDDISKGGKDGGKPQTDLPKKDPEVLPPQAKVHAKVKGKFCPQAKNKLTILFVVDYSGSMGRHVPEQGQAEIPGNDPQIDGSCGRLRAAQAIISKIRSEKVATDSVEIGMVPFAGGIVTSKIVSIIDLESFEKIVSKDTFCQYVVQGPSFGYDPANPGGIEGPAGFLGLGRVDSSTNYTAAFTAAQSMLQGVYGRKVTYFISDGQPTSGGADPVLAGIAAGKMLRESVDNLVLNGLLLGQTGPQAMDVLAQVAGSPDRVRRADNADELAKEILEFPEASIDEQSGRATLTVVPYPAADLGLRYLTKDPASAGVWVYETQPFVLLGKPGQVTLNEVIVTAKGTDGSTHSAKVVIRYRQ